MKVARPLSFLKSSITFQGAFLAVLLMLGGSEVRGADLEIDRVDVLGVQALASDLIERAVEVVPGDRLERVKVIRTEENLQNLYRIHGYEEMAIRSRLIRKNSKKTDGRTLLETVLEFQVTEGAPTRISGSKLVEMDSKDDSLTRSWKEHERKLIPLLNQIKGEIFDQEKTVELKRSIQEYFISEGHVGTRIEVSYVDARPDPAVPHEAARWVTLKFQVDPGEKISFGFRGNTIFTKGYLSSLVEEQRVLGLGKDFKGAVKTRLQEEYYASGFAQVQIQAFSVEDAVRRERRVTYLIQEGPQVRVESLDFDGNSIFSSADLRERFYKRASLTVRNGFYVERDVQKAAELMIEGLREKGYLSARLITISSRYRPVRKTHIHESRINLTIYVYEGDQTVVQSSEFKGVTVLAQEEVKQLLKVEEGKPLNLFALGEGIESLKRAYYDRGYLGFRILNESTDSLVQYSQENRAAGIFLEVDEGYPYRVSKIQVDGLVNTREPIVRRELKFIEGDLLTETKLIQSERQLRKLGIFSGVTFQTEDDPGKPGYKLVKMSLSEGDRGVLTVGPGYRNDLGARAFGQLAYNNLWGENHTLLVNMNMNRRFQNYNFVEGQGLVAYAWPWFGLPDLTFRPAIAVGKTQFINFAADNVTISASLEKPILTRPNLIGNVSYSFEQINQTNAVNPVDNQKVVIGTISPKLTLDLRDNPLAPSSGFFTAAWMDFAYPFLGSQTEPFPIGYYRAQFRTDYYVPLFRELVWFTSLRAGFEKSTQRTLASTSGLTSSDTDAIPLIKQFALGGVGSLRGYAEQALNKGSSVVRSGLSYVNYRTELGIPVAGSLKLGLFLDGGNLFVDEASLYGFKYGAGFGLHYVTPVGAINFDWGFKVDPKPLDEPYIIHISVGVI